MKRKNFMLFLMGIYLISIIVGVWLIFAKQPLPREKIRYSPHIPSLPPTWKEGIALVRIYGPIRVSLGEGWSPFISGADQIVSKLKRIRKDKRIKAVVLRINSPGGSVAAVQEIYEEIKKLRKENKIVVASLGDVGTSGAYYVACAADKIVVNPGTLTGSIGVLIELGNLEELFKKIGVKIVTIKSGKHKDIGTYARQMSKKEREILQNLIDQAYQQFIQAIVEGRKMKREKVLALADGRVFIGSQAQKEGLVDLIGNSEYAIELAAKLAGIKKPAEIITEFEPLEKIFRILLRDYRKESNLPKFLKEQKVRFEYIWE